MEHRKVGIDREALTSALDESWGADTSASPEKWTHENRALSQCAVTACIVQDYLGGDIFNTTAALPDGSTDSHYYNVINIINDTAIDFTSSQFPDGTTFSEGAPKTKEFGSTREYILSYEAVAARYRILSERVASK